MVKMLTTFFLTATAAITGKQELFFETTSKCKFFKNLLNLHEIFLYFIAKFVSNHEIETKIATTNKENILQISVFVTDRGSIKILKLHRKMKKYEKKS